ncbi:uncharacterized protein F13E9.13, mitochondrial-like isoform X2 [Oratosquilla oratoria]|uniref:uncharacterized protein F13E9.13, mitochondrial-like isoform X2 n=1 Tax=Oratosquilla oratoria TaxID=337810 RepID=UPI003F767254
MQQLGWVRNNAARHITSTASPLHLIGDPPSASPHAEKEKDGILVENMHDIPYLQGAELGPEVTATMARVCSAVKQIIPSSLPCGVQILAGGNKEALAVSKACNLQFIRAECFVFSHIADEGLMNASAGPLLRYRKMIEADDVLVFTDIKKKHSAHSLTADLDVVEMAKAADFFSADGVILTGNATGCEADENQLRNVVAQVSLPVLVGSGVTVDNVDKFSDAHGLIVGSHFKADGRWNAELDFNRVKIFVEHVQNFRARTISSDLHRK